MMFSHTLSDTEPPYESSCLDSISTVSACHNVPKRTYYGLSQTVESICSPTLLDNGTGPLSETDRLQELHASTKDGHLEDVTEDFVDKKLERLDRSDLVLYESLLDLERAVAMLELSSEHLVRVLKRTQSSSSSISKDSASVYSRGESDDEASGLDSNTQGSTAAAVWQNVAENTTLPDSDDDDDDHIELLSWHTEASNKPLEDKPSLPSQNPDLIAQEIIANGNMTRDDTASLKTVSPASDTVAITPHSTPPLRESTTPTFLAPPPHSRRRERRSADPPRKPPTHPRLTTVHKTACACTPQTLATCLLGPKITIVNGTTSEIYVSDVPLQMLFLFCGSAVIGKLLPGYAAPQETLEIPETEAEHGGITRVMRHMRRCCAQARTHTSSGEMRIPQGALGDGIETVRACRVLGLHPDAERFEKLLVENVLSGRISDENIDLIWNGYYTRLRETSLGEAVVWFILKEMQSGENAMVEELMQLVERDEFKELKERIREENKIRLWRTESRDEFLERWAKERRRTARKKARLERWERENVERMEWLRTRNREEHTRWLAERELQAPIDSRSSLSRHSTSGSVRSKAKDGSFRSLDTGKVLPKTPSQDRILQTESTPQLGTSSTRSVESTGSGGAPQEVDHKPDITSPSLITSNRPVTLLSWQGPRPVPVPKKKLSLWKRLKAVL